MVVRAILPKKTKAPLLLWYYGTMVEVLVKSHPTRVWYGMYGDWYGMAWYGTIPYHAIPYHTPYTVEKSCWWSCVE